MLVSVYKDSVSTGGLAQPGGHSLRKNVSLLFDFFKAFRVEQTNTHEAP